MDTVRFNKHMEAIGELQQAGSHAACLDAIRAMRSEILAAPDPAQLGWARFYELRALFELGRHDEALAALARPEPVGYVIGARNAAWMSSVASEMAMNLGRIDDLVRHGRACLESRSGADRILCCETVCNLLWVVGRDDLNREFATELVELGRRHDDRPAVVRGLHAILDACAIAPDPDLLALVRRTETAPDEDIAARLASVAATPPATSIAPGPGEPRFLSAAPAASPAPAELSLTRCDGQAWFDPDSPHDRRVVGLEPAVAASPLARGYASVEVDSIEHLRVSAKPETIGGHTTIIFQQWGPPASDGGRPYFWLDRATASELGATLRRTPARRLMLLFTTVQDGALRILADALIDGRPAGDFRMETLALAWYFSGDDITDDDHHVADVAYAATRLQVRRLSVLTGGWNAACDRRLAAELSAATTLESFAVFAKDEAHTWPQLTAPLVDALVGRS